MFYHTLDMSRLLKNRLQRSKKLPVSQDFFINNPCPKMKHTTVSKKTFFCSLFSSVATIYAPYANTCSKPTFQIVEQHTGSLYPANIYLFKVSSRNNRKRCKICSDPRVIEVILASLWLTLILFHIFF